MKTEKRQVFRRRVFACIVALICCFANFALPQTAYANMAAPTEADVASSITFEKNDAISVLWEVIDITVNGSLANIVVTYKMRNTTDSTVVTPVMFLSPNIEGDRAKVTVDNSEIEYTTKTYVLTSSTIEVDDWQYVVLEEEEYQPDEFDRRVDAVNFELDFAPNGEQEVTLSYVYRLGGYPDYDFDAKMGIIQYYLSPAAMWKGFENLTINVYLDEDMPVIKQSNLEFEKIDDGTYQYVSDTLPEGNLQLVIDENWFQSIFSTLRSPYLRMNILYALPLILFILFAIIALCVVIHIVRKRKNKQDK